MVPLVEGKQAEQIRRRAGRGDGAAAVPVDGGGIIGKGGCREVATINQKGEDVLVGKCAGEFKVRVGDGAETIAVGDEATADIVGKGGAPEGWGVG
jgi:hypothetical protein